MVEQDIIQASDLVRTFGRVRVLDGLTLDLREGEIFGLVGPNGAGKTTFIRIVVGLLRRPGADLVYERYSVDIGSVDRRWDYGTGRRPFLR